MSGSRKWLLPISWMCGTVLRVRHALFDYKIVAPQLGKLPTIVIGNLALGGTGKTPHAEYVLKQLRAWCRPALLSRGYGRKTKGFIWANRIDATAELIGDEPMQVHMKFPDVDVAVCEDRLRGLHMLKTATNSSIVVLDDAFQHRKLQGDLNILLTEYDRPYWNDQLFPVGRLRDLKSAAKRAHVLIVTKCPSALTPDQQQEMIKAMRPTTRQRVFFTQLVYGEPIQVEGPGTNLVSNSKILGLAGLADTTKFEAYLSSNFDLNHFESFADHHNFSRKELGLLWTKYGNLVHAIVTTEKDAARLKSIRGLNDIPIFVIPISIAFLGGEAAFMQLLRST